MYSMPPFPSLTRKPPSPPPPFHNPPHTQPPLKNYPHPSPPQEKRTDKQKEKISSRFHPTPTCRPHQTNLLLAPPMSSPFLHPHTTTQSRLLRNSLSMSLGKSFVKPPSAT